MSADPFEIVGGGTAFGEPIPPRPLPERTEFFDADGLLLDPVAAAVYAMSHGGFTTPLIEAQRMIRDGGVLAERARRWLRDELRWRLRGSDRERVGRIARGGGPSRVGDRFHLYCPVCGCRKSGDLDIPNGRDGDVCDDSDCPCHEEDE